MQGYTKWNGTGERPGGETVVKAVMDNGTEHKPVAAMYLSWHRPKKGYFPIVEWYRIVGEK